MPSWRVKPFDISYSMKGTEDMSDDTYKRRHAKLEIKERKQIR